MSERIGKFIVFEGLDGCGKSTQLEYLRKKLSMLCRPAGKRKVFATREPSDSVPGVICRGISKRTIFAQNETEALLFAADRCEHVANEILPQINAGNHVLCDRFFLSNFAYQSAEVDINAILNYNMSSMKQIMPDLTVFFDVPPEECERRRAAERATEEKHENIGRLKIVRENYYKSINFLKENNIDLNLLYINWNESDDSGQVFDKLWTELVNKNVFSDEDYI